MQWKKKKSPGSLTHRWTFACIEWWLQHRLFISSAKKGRGRGGSPTLMFNVSCLSAQMDGSKKIKSSAITVCDVCVCPPLCHWGIRWLRVCMRPIYEIRAARAEIRPAQREPLFQPDVVKGVADRYDDQCWLHATHHLLQVYATSVVLVKTRSSQ